MKTKRIGTATLTVILLCAASAGAQSDGNPVDLRVGVTSWDHLDQIHLGLGTNFGEIAPAIDLRPNVEIGFGEEWTVLTINGDLVYNFTEVTSYPWGLFAGGGIAFNYYDGPHFDGETDLGLNGVIGLRREMQNGHSFLMELRLGLMDSPDVKFTLGYSLF